MADVRIIVDGWDGDAARRKRRERIPQAVRGATESASTERQEKSA
jgi:hypothetical protein